MDKKIAFSISTYTNNVVVLQQTIDCIKNIKENTEFDVICCNHHPGNDELVNVCDIHIYDKKNILIPHNFFDSAWVADPLARADLNLKESQNDMYHGPAVHNNIFNGISIGNSLGYEYIISVNYDVLFNKQEFELINSILNDIQEKNKEGFFLLANEQDGLALKTAFFICTPSLYLNNFKNISSTLEYEKLISENKCQCNSLENLYYNILTDKLDNLIIEKKTEHEMFPSGKNFKTFQAEYSAVLPIVNPKDNKNVALLYKSNNYMGNKLSWEIEFNGDVILTHDILAKDNHFIMSYFDFKMIQSETYSIRLKDIDNKKTLKEFTNCTYEDVKRQGTFSWLF